MIVTSALLAAAIAQPASPQQPLSLVGIPVLGADSDLGFVLGLMGIVTRPRDDDDFLWQLQVMAGTSFKSDDQGTSWPLQRHFLRLR